MVEKNYFKQRVPGFIDPRGLIPVEFEFTETQELLEHPYIQHWLNRNPPSNVVKTRNNVMVEEKEGFICFLKSLCFYFSSFLEFYLITKIRGIFGGF